jgi:hypothetical protein
MNIPGQRMFWQVLTVSSGLYIFGQSLHLDVSTEQVARQMNKPVLGWLPLLPLLLIGCLAIKLGAALKCIWANAGDRVRI